MIQTRSAFIYDTRIYPQKNLISFDEGSGEIVAEIEAKDWAFSEIAQAIEDAMNAVGGQEYTVTLSFDTRLITISASSNFSLNGTLASEPALLANSRLGFQLGTNYSGFNSYSGINPFGKVYVPQFLLQSYSPPELSKESIGANYYESASGDGELVRLGQKQIVEMNITLATNLPQSERSPIKNNPQGKDQLIELMDHLIDKSKVEFLEDKDAPDNSMILRLESTLGYGDGTGFKLKELYAQGAPEYFETGILTFRRNI
jgi:hypothetical protein